MLVFKNIVDFPAGPLAKTLCPRCGVPRVLSPVGELRSPVPQCRQKLWFMGRGQKCRHEQEFERSWFQPSWMTTGVQDFRGGRGCRHGGNSRRTRISRGAWSCDWNGATSWYDSNRWGVAPYGWAEKGFLRWNVLLVKKLWRLEMITKDSEYYINLVKQ